MSDMMTLDKSVLVFGSAALDAKARANDFLVQGSSVPGQILLSAGGVARNVAECLARFEVPTSLCSAVGDDPLGEYVLGVTERAGVDVSPTIRVPGETTSAYFAMLERDGALAWSIYEMNPLAYLTPEVVLRHRDALFEASAVVMDNNLPLDTTETIIRLCGEAGVPLCADPTSRFLAARFIPFLPHFSLIIPNQNEAAILCDCPVENVDDALKAARQLVRMGVGMALITLGSGGAVYATANERGHVPAPGVNVVDLTGGSDAMTATVVYGLIQDFPVDEAVRLAVTAASLTITSQDTVRSDLTLEMLYDSLLV
jgi:pseudouridine kinase